MILKLVDILLIVLVGALGAWFLTVHGREDWALAALVVALAAARLA